MKTHVRARVVRVRSPHNAALLRFQPAAAASPRRDVADIQSNAAARYLKRQSASARVLVDTTASS
jgi:hypothetical protein